MIRQTPIAIPWAPGLQSRSSREVGAVRRAGGSGRRALIIPFGTFSSSDFRLAGSQRRRRLVLMSNRRRPHRVEGGPWRQPTGRLCSASGFLPAIWSGNPFASSPSNLYNRAGSPTPNHKTEIRSTKSGIRNLHLELVWHLGLTTPRFAPEFSDIEFGISNLIGTLVSTDGSVTHLIGEMKAGNPQALDELYRAYFPRLVALARKKLSQSPPLGEDEEDVVQSVFGRLCQIAERGWYPSLQNRNDLWVLLFCLTARKIGRLKRKHLPIPEANILHPGEQIAGDEARGLESLLDHEPTPEEAAAFAEDVKQRLDALNDDILRQVAQWKMENFTDEEIAHKLGCVTRTVERKLWVIRNTWESKAT